MCKLFVVSAFVVVLSEVVLCGIIHGGHETISLVGGGDDYGGASYGAAGGDHSLSYGGLESAGAEGLHQGGGGGDGDFHHGTSVVGGGGQAQGQTLDLTDHAGGHGHGIFGGSFISAGVGGKSGHYAEEGGHEGLGSYAGSSSYDVGSHGGGEISGVLSSSVHDIPLEAFHHH